MRNHHFFLAVLALVLFACCAQAQKDASMVLGASDFTTIGDVIPYCVCTSPLSGKIFVSSEQKIYRFTSAPLLVLGALPDAVLGTAGQGDGQVGAVGGVFIDETDALWTADTSNHRVFKAESISSATSLKFSLVLGQTDFTSNYPESGLTRMNQPYHALVDSVRNNVWVADSVNNRVSRFANASTLTTGANLTSFLGTGTAGLTPSDFDRPIYTALDFDGNLYIADYNNRRVLKFDNAHELTSGASASLVLGQSDFTSNILITSQSTFTPIFIFFYYDTLYVNDFQNQRVLIFEQAYSLSNGAPATDLIGQPDFTTSAARPISQSTITGPRGLAISNTALIVGAQNEGRVLVFTIGAPNTTSSSATASITPTASTTTTGSGSASGSTSGSATGSVTGSASKSYTGFASKSAWPSQSPRNSAPPTRSNSPSLGSCGNGVIDAGERCDPSVDDRCCTKGCAFKAGGKKCGPKKGECYKTPRCNATGICVLNKTIQGRCKVNPSDATKTGICLKGTCMPSCA